jgi:hypothetical protein
MKNSLTREEWLEKAVELARPYFKGAGSGFTVPEVRVSTGWPSHKATTKLRTLGQCWIPEAADDKKSHIFISPVVKESFRDDGWGCLPILLHELCHAVTPGDGHGHEFKTVARSIGLEGKLTSTTAGERALEWCRRVVEKIGEYPHAALNPTMSGKKKQTTRLVKCECGDCGYVARTTLKWIEEIGAPLCQCNRKPMGYATPAGRDEPEDPDED